MKDACIEARVSEPVFEITVFFTVTFFKNPDKKFGDFGVHISEKQIEILKLIQKDTKISAKRIAEKLNMLTRAIEKSLKDLREKDLIQRNGTA